MGAVEGARAVAPGTGVIIHRAAATSLPRSIEDPVGTSRLNVAAPGCQPPHDLNSGIATVWPEWAPAGTGAAATDGKAAL